MHERQFQIGFLHFKCQICTHENVHDIVIFLKTLKIHLLHLIFPKFVSNMQICKFTKHRHKLRQMPNTSLKMLNLHHWKAKPTLPNYFFFGVHGWISKMQSSIQTCKNAIWQTILTLCKLLWPYKLTFYGAISGFDNACSALGCLILCNCGDFWKFANNEKLNLELQFLHCRDTFLVHQVWHDGGHFRDRPYVSWRQAKTSKCGSAFRKCILRASKCSPETKTSEECDYTSPNANWRFCRSFNTFARQKIGHLEVAVYQFVRAYFALPECLFNTSNA